MGSGKESKEKPKRDKFSENELEKWARENGVPIKTVKGGTSVVFKPKKKK